MPTYSSHYTVHTERFGLEPKLFTLLVDAKRYAAELTELRAYCDQIIYVSLVLFDLIDAHIIMKHYTLITSYPAPLKERDAGRQIRHYDQTDFEFRSDDSSFA